MLKKMNILQVDNVDLVGRIFNGHNLQISLNELGYHSCQAVKYKYGNEDNTILLGQFYTDNVNSYLGYLESDLSMNHMLGVWDRYLENSKVFQGADIVHYHKIHVGIIPFYRFPRLVKKKSSVWTIHDPWAFTGHCVHSLECTKWQIGCPECTRLEDDFSIRQDKASQLWEIKKYVFSDIDIDIVVSTTFMENYIKKSPFTSHLKRVHKIPFGIKLDTYNQFNKLVVRTDLNINNNDFVIGFRTEDYFIKGCKYIYEALGNISDNQVVIMTVGNGKLPEDIRNRFRHIELGWINSEDMISKFYTACDLFLMPSLAESFGVMAIEAMAAECVVIVFKNTVLENLVFSPECGIAVEYKNSDAIGREINYFLKNPVEVKKRGEKARIIVNDNYSYSNYLRKHIELYEDIYERKLFNKKYLDR